MKVIVTILLSGLFSLACCEERPHGQPQAMSKNSRVTTIAAKVRPILERDLAAMGLHFGDPVFLRALKEERLLELYILHRETAKFALFRTYPIAGSSGELGPKLEEGDGQVPEGFYYVPPVAMNPNSVYHLAFNVGYPNELDRSLKRTGSSIMVHGNRVSIGCLAMTDEKIEEIYTLCDAAHHGGQKFFRIHIFPFRMTEERLASESENLHIEFWKNLKEGYTWFENRGIPPEVDVRDARYQFR